MVTTRLIGDRRNGYNSDEQNTEFCKDKVTRGLRSLQHLPEGPTVQLKDIQNVIDAFHFLDSVIDYLPAIECWCVIKKYAMHTMDNKPWPDAIWIGCTTKEQAEAMAPAIQARYQREYDRPMLDRFVMEFRPTRIGNIIRPDLSVEEYIRSIS